MDNLGNICNFPQKHPFCGAIYIPKDKSPSISIGYFVVYSIFAEDAVFEEKFAKQNGLFEEI